MPILVQKVSLDAAEAVRGCVVVIDVLRAFTTAAVAFHAGAKRIVPVLSVPEAFAIRERDPGVVLMGEENWLPVPGFDYGNSPSALDGVDLAGRTVVQRTTAGTRGLVLAAGGDPVFAGSFSVVSATVRAIRAAGVDSVTCVISGSIHGVGSDEDAALADYLEAALLGGEVSSAPYLDRVRNSAAAKVFRDPRRAEFCPPDVDCAVAIDRFDFAMQLARGEDDQMSALVRLDAIPSPEDFR